MVDYIKELESLLNKAELCSALALQAKLPVIADMLERANLAIRSYKIELLDIPQNQKKIYEESLNIHKANIKKLSERYSWLTKSARPNNSQMTDNQILNEANMLLDDSAKSLIRSKQLVNDSHQIGASTMVALSEQRNQLNNINKEVDDIQNNLKRAGKQLNNFIRRMATDKLILCLICLIISASIVLICISLIDARHSAGEHNNTNSTSYQ